MYLQAVSIITARVTKSNWANVIWAEQFDRKLSGSPSEGARSRGEARGGMLLP